MQTCVRRRQNYDERQQSAQQKRKPAEPTRYLQVKPATAGRQQGGAAVPRIQKLNQPAGTQAGIRKTVNGAGVRCAMNGAVRSALCAER